MRQDLIALVLGAALIGGLFFAASHRAQTARRLGADAAASRAAAAEIKSGFVGVKRIGAWEVVCSPSPVMLPARKTPTQPSDAAKKAPPLPLFLDGSSGDKGTAEATRPAPAPTHPPVAARGAAEAKVSLGRCRATQVFRRKGAPEDEVALAVNFRFVGKTLGRLGLFVRLPPGNTKQGETLQLRLGKGGFKLPIASCGSAGCVAVAILAADAQRTLTAARAAELLMPPGSGGKRAGVRLIFAGLGPALMAIRRAQS